MKSLKNSKYRLALKKVTIARLQFLEMGKIIGGYTDAPTQLKTKCTSCGGEACKIEKPE